MTRLFDYPVLIFAITFLTLWFATWMGGRLRRLQSDPGEEMRSDFGIVLGATLTLLGLIIGFTFSMSIARYDLRKSYEEAEANAIGTEYLRADLLPAQDAAEVRTLLVSYTDLRIRFYETRSMDELRQIKTLTAAVQGRLWAAASRSALAKPTPMDALAVAGMNDVLNAEGYTQAAWWNRIPMAAWMLMFGIALFCNCLIGYGARRLEKKLFMVLPVVVAVSFFLIADIDSPRGGVIQVQPQNLVTLSLGLHGR